MSGRRLARVRAVGSLLAFPVSVALLGGAASAAGEQGGELGIQFGVLAPDADLSGRPQTWGNVEPAFGIRGGWHFAPRWGWFADGALTIFDSQDADDVTSYAARTGFEWLHRPHWTDYQTFFALGGGWNGVDRDAGADFSRWFGSLSGGQRFTVGANQLLRWELRVDYTVTDDGLAGRDMATGHLLLGYTWGMPDRARDTDGDGVPDRKDACPDTPRGARVDGAGCPLDGDRDGVFDGIDRCPDTPAGWGVDSTGCPLDGDGDGVPDGRDRCPGTPPGAVVDEAGCPLDGDEDGVHDGIDRCPDTPRFAHVDARGCPSDSDGDGVLDGIDRCPQTAPGTEVDEHGCPVARPLFEEERRTLVLDGVFFELNSAKLTPNSKEILDAVAESLLAWPEVRVEIGGHTDSTGSEAYNQRLSALRAAAVRDYLLERGVDAARLVARGYGEGRPVADNRSEGGRARNRRVELTRLD